MQVKCLAAYVPAFGLGMGGIFVGAVGAAVVTLPKRTLEAVPERQAIKGLRSFEQNDAEIFELSRLILTHSQLRVRDDSGRLIAFTDCKH